MAKKVIDLVLLVAVAKELQELCQFDPPIKTKGKTEEELKLKIVEAAKQLGPDDELTEDAIFVLNELGAEIGDGEPVAEEEEEEAPAPKKAAPKAAPAPAPAKKAVAKPAPADEEEEEEEEEVPATPAKKAAAPAKKAAPTTKLSSEEKIKFFSPLIESGEHTMKDLVAASLEQFPGLSESSVRTFLVDSKNPKYNKFPNLVVQDAEGKLSFQAPAAKKKVAAKG